MLTRQRTVCIILKCALLAYRTKTYFSSHYDKKTYPGPDISSTNPSLHRGQLFSYNLYSYFIIISFCYALSVLEDSIVLQKILCHHPELPAKIDFTCSSIFSMKKPQVVRKPLNDICFICRHSTFFVGLQGRVQV